MLIVTCRFLGKSGWLVEAILTQPASRTVAGQGSLVLFLSVPRFQSLASYVSGQVRLAYYCDDVGSKALRIFVLSNGDKDQDLREDTEREHH